MTTTTTTHLLDTEPTLTVKNTQHARSAKYAFVGKVEGHSSHEVYLAVYHSKELKAFGVTVGNVEVVKEPGSPFVVEKFSPLDSVRLPSIPVGRFSEKALRAAAEESLATLRSLKGAEAIEEVVRKAQAGEVDF